ncbi:MAG: hypothetical protein M0019_05750 [Actinomycetota bacterium]|nr:hypothetical protein [Actinomycetota bacterium]
MSFRASAAINELSIRRPLQIALISMGFITSSCGGAAVGSTSTTSQTTVKVKTTYVTTSIPPVTTTTSPAVSATSPQSVPATPTLGLSNIYSGGLGFGEVEPTKIYLGGDPTGLLSKVQWSTWGGSSANGVGVGEYVGPSQVVAQGKLETATVVAFDLGSCNGIYAYQKVEWYFPGEGETFNPAHAITTCLFFGQPPS